MNCKKCGVELLEGSLFCNKCGEKILVEEIKKVNSDDIGGIDQTHVKEKTHFVMKKIFIFPILGTVLLVLYYSTLKYMNDNDYKFVEGHSYLSYLIPISIIFLILPLIIMAFKKIKNIYKNRDKRKVINVVNEKVDGEDKDGVIKKKRFTPVKIVVMIIIIGAIVGGGIIYSNKQKAIKAEKAEVAYMASLKEVTLLITMQGVKIEKDAQEISTVWHDAIFSEPVTVNGKQAYTFDTALQYKNEEFKENGEMDAIIKGKSVIKSSMDKLANPPIKYKEAYELVIKIYTSYNEFEDMVESPNGNLTGYNEKFNTIDGTLSSQIQEFGTRYPVGK